MTVNCLFFIYENFFFPLNTALLFVVKKKNFFLRLKYCQSLAFTVQFIKWFILQFCIAITDKKNWTVSINLREKNFCFFNLKNLIKLIKSNLIKCQFVGHWGEKRVQNFWRKRIWRKFSLKKFHNIFGSKFTFFFFFSPLS